MSEGSGKGLGSVDGQGKGPLARLRSENARSDRRSDRERSAVVGNSSRGPPSEPRKSGSGMLGPIVVGSSSRGASFSSKHDSNQAERREEPRRSLGASSSHRVDAKISSADSGQTFSALGGGLESSGPPSALDGGENEPARAAGPGFPPRRERLSSGIPPPGSGQASSPFSRLSPPAAVKRVHRSALSGYAAPVLEDSEGERRALAQTSAADAGHQNVPPATTPRAKQRSLPAIGALAKRSNTDGGSIVKLGRDSPSATDTSGFISAERSDSSSDGIASRILYSAPWLVFVGATLVYSVSLLPLWTTWVMQSVTNRWMAANVAESLTLAAVYLADAVLIAVAQREGLVPPPHNRALSICMTCIDFLIPGILVVNAVAPYFVTEQLFAHGYTEHQPAISVSSGIGLGGVPRLIVTLWFLVELCYLKWPRLISNCTVAWHLRRNRRSEPEDRSKPSVLAREVSQIALILVLLFSICVSGISHQANLSTSHIMELEQYLSQVEIVAILTSTLAPSDMERVMIALAQPIHESPGYSGILELLCGQAGFTHDGLDHVDPTSGDHIHEHPHETLLMFWEDQDLGCHAIVNITPWGTSLASEIMTERTVLLVFTMGLAAMVAFIHSMVVVRPLESILSRISACAVYLEDDGTLMDVNHDLMDFKEAFSSPEDMFMSRLRARGPLTMEQAVERVVNMTSHLIRASWQPGASGLRALLRDVRRQKYDPIFREVVTAFEQNMLLGAGSQNGVVSPSRSRRASGITRFAMEAAGQREGGSRTSMSAQSQDRNSRIASQRVRSRTFETTGRATSVTSAGRPVDIAAAAGAHFGGGEGSQREGRSSNGVAEGVSLQVHLAKLGSWDWNVLQLDYSALAPVCLVMFKVVRLSQMCEPENLERFVNAVLDSYNAVPYHNAWHAVDCLHAMMMLLVTTPALWRSLTVLDRFALMLAALTHDTGHLGVNNAFLIANRDRLALMYNDHAVQESMHAALSFQIALQRDGCNIFSKLSEREFARVRSAMLSCIMATDMSSHFAIVSQLRLLLTRDRSIGQPQRPGPQARKVPTHPGVPSRVHPDKGAGDSGLPPVPKPAAQNIIQTQEDKALVMNAMLHAVDVAKLAKREDLAKLWGSRLMEEFWSQGDRERSMGREPNRIFDRTKASAPEALAGYCEVITLPILHALSQLFPSSATSSLLRGALHSFVIWSREQHVALCADLARPAPTRSPSDHTMKIPGTARATAGDSEAPRSQAAPASPRTRQSDKGRGVRASRDAEIARGPASKTGHGDAADPREPDPGSQTDGAQAGPTRRRNPSLGIEPPRDGKEGRVKGWVRKSVPGGTGGNGGVARGAKGPENGSNRSWRLDVARGLVRVGEQFQRVVGQFGPSVGLVGMNLDPPQEAVDIVKAAAEGSKGGSSKKVSANDG